MAWKAKLVSVPQTNDISDSFFAEILYHDDATGRQFQQSFKFVAGSGLTLSAAQQMVADKIAALTALDNAKALLIPKIGLDIA